MRYFCFYGKNDERKEVFIDKLETKDMLLFQEWIEFDKKNNPNCRASERCNYLLWDMSIRSDVILRDGLYYKIVSNKNKKPRLEGLIKFYLVNNTIRIDSLEVAPWNRLLYCGDSREFKYMGILLIGFAIYYGIINGVCDIMRLESLENRKSYYRDALNMHEESHDEFYFLKIECLDFVQMLIHKELFIEG